MIDKRGQITIFIIVAILLIAVAVLFFVFRSSLGFGQSSLDPETEKVFLFVQDCTQRTFKDSLYNIGQRGGYYTPQTLINSNGVPYYIYKGKVYYPTLENVSKEIESYVDANIDYCLGEFKEFPQYNISKGKENSKVNIKEKEIDLEMNYPITIHRVEEKTDIETFKVNAYSRLKEMHDFAGKIIGNYSTDGLCLSCIQEISEKQNFKVEISNDNEGITIGIIDQTPKAENYEFKFGIYNG